MNCPECHIRLPARFALIFGWAAVTCPSCRSSLQATRESATQVTRSTGKSGFVGGLIGALMAVFVAYPKRQWSLVVAVGVTLVVISFLWSWYVALRNLKFETSRASPPK
jgi:hypothetical protein